LSLRTYPNTGGCGPKSFEPKRTTASTATNRSAFGQMPRYYFDERDNEKFVIDDDGVEIDTFEHVKAEASRAMADFAKDVLPGSVVRVLAIEVRDKLGPVLRVKLCFEIEHVLTL
jgi:hypothetical protein